jgi:tRNA pseudouridine55 synthase
MVVALKKQFPQLVHARIGYAGRLDPMAEGLLLLLTGEENKKRVSYEKLTKVYSIDVLFGFASDTHDILGLVTHEGIAINKEELDISLPRTLSSLIGSYEQPYPDYSAKRVKGKPLYYWARENLLSGMVRPTKTIHITSIKLLKTHLLTQEQVHSSIEERIAKIHGTFRQKEILLKWKDVLGKTPVKEFPIASIQVLCSSGTYMRSLAHRMGELTRIPALAWSIRRDQIGDITIEDTQVLKEL